MQLTRRMTQLSQRLNFPLGTRQLFPTHSKKLLLMKTLYRAAPSSFFAFSFFTFSSFALSLVSPSHSPALRDSISPSAFFPFRSLISLSFRLFRLRSSLPLPSFHRSGAPLPSPCSKSHSQANFVNWRWREVQGKSAHMHAKVTSASARVLKAILCSLFRSNCSSGSRRSNAGTMPALINYWSFIGRSAFFKFIHDQQRSGPQCPLNDASYTGALRITFSGKSCHKSVWRVNYWRKSTCEAIMSCQCDGGDCILYKSGGDLNFKWLEWKQRLRMISAW